MTEPTHRQWRLPRLRLSLLPLLLALLLLIVVGVLYARGLSTPVLRTGHPTSTVAPLPVPTPVSAMSSPAASATAEQTSAATDVTTAASPSPTAGQSSAAKSSGKFATAAVNISAVGVSGTLHRYTVRVETSLGANADSLGRGIATVLNDPRSWAGAGDVRFALVSDPKKADFSITLASSATAVKSCQPSAGSCAKGTSIVMDAAAWSAAPTAFASLDAWHAYLVNHAVGRFLGEPAEKCAKKGKPAPVMLDQSGNLGGCTANPWPNP